MVLFCLCYCTCVYCLVHLSLALREQMAVSAWSITHWTTESHNRPVMLFSMSLQDVQKGPMFYIIGRMLNAYLMPIHTHTHTHMKMHFQNTCIWALWHDIIHLFIIFILLIDINKQFRFSWSAFSTNYKMPCCRRENRAMPLYFSTTALCMRLLWHSMGFLYRPTSATVQMLKLHHTVRW